MQTVMQNCVTEYTFQSQKDYADPFNDIELSVFFVGPNGAEQTVPCFWAGGNEWRVRCSSPTTGTYRYESRCSDTSDGGLHGKTGELEIVPYEGDNPLLQHGGVRVSDNKRHFEHQDGTPFSGSAISGHWVWSSSSGGLRSRRSVCCMPASS